MSGVSLSASGGYGNQPNWRQARAEIREEANAETVAEALLPELRSDEDGVVEIQFGTALWDYGQAVKTHTRDERSVQQIVEEIARDNPFISDVDELPAGECLDLSKYFNSENEGAQGSEGNSGRHSGPPLLAPENECPPMPSSPANCPPMTMPPSRHSGGGQENCLTSGNTGNNSGISLINTQSIYYSPQNQFYFQQSTTLLHVPSQNG